MANESNIKNCSEDRNPEVRTARDYPCYNSRRYRTKSRSLSKRLLLGGKEADMPNRFHTVVLAILLGAIALPAFAQQRGAQQRKPVPAVGAWWYRGTQPPASVHPDLTGVWFGGASGDLSKNTLPGQQLILTPFGKQRYDTVDHSKDPNTQCLPPGPARMIMMAHPAMIVQRDDVVTILTESQRTFRLIYTDGRGHPSDVYDYPEW